MTPLADALDRFQRAIQNYKDAHTYPPCFPSEVKRRREVLKEAEKAYLDCMLEQLEYRKAEKTLEIQKKVPFMPRAFKEDD